MKIKSLLLIIWVAAFYSSNAQQVPNAGFETWSNPKNPDGWFTYSSVSPVIDLSSKDITDKVEGSASAKIQTVYMSGIGSTIYELLSLGSGYYSFIGSGIHYTYIPAFFPFRPDTLFFSYKYSSPGIDTASAFIKLSTGNNTLLEKVIPLYKNSEWASTSILLTPLYLNSETPDSLLIQFKSSIANGKYYGTPGSVLNIDAIRFGYVILPASLKELRNDLKVRIFPNPSSQTVNIQISEPVIDASIKIYDITGLEILNEPMLSEKQQVQVGKWQNGIYSYVITSKNKTILNGRFVVHK